MTTLSARELTRELLRFNTINPPGQERDCARRVGALFENAGFTVAYHEFADGRTNLVARIGSSTDKAPICFTGHLDTVPLGAAPWTRDPFAGETDGNRLYGRGASDMKCGIAAFTIALLEIAPHLARTAGVVVVLTAGEETGCEGANFLAEHPEMLGRAGAIVVAEPTGNYPIVGHKGAYWLRAVTRGKTAHGSMPELGDNALYKAARAVSALEHFHFSDPPHPLMGGATLNVGTMHGGLNINSVPDRAEVCIDIRTVPGQDHERLRSELGRALGPEVELSAFMDVPAVYTEPTDPWIQSVFEVMTPHLGERPAVRTATYFTDAAALRAGYGAPPTIVLGPGEPQLAHQTDEYCLVSRIDQAVELYERIIDDWCRG